jgi:hypothetical protein
MEQKFRSDLYYRLNVFPYLCFATTRAARGHSDAGAALCAAI